MQDLIERRAALTALCEDCLQKYEGICPHPASRCVEFRTIKQLPAIDAEPVRHGRWAKAADKQYCTNCRAVTKVLNAPFCWHCGAQMDFRTPTEVQLDDADSVMMGSADNG